MTAVPVQFVSSAQQRHAATFGMWVFLATELMFFGPLFLGYGYLRWKFPDAVAAASPHTDVVLGTLNTALLLTSSLTMAAAVEAARLDAKRVARWLLVATAVLGGAFLAIKGFEYSKEWGEGLLPGAGFHFPSQQYAAAAELFFVLYFAMTAVHALHLTIGVVMTLSFALLGRASLRQAGSHRLEIAGLYWHFVDIVWIFLYPLLYLVGRAS